MLLYGVEPTHPSTWNVDWSRDQSPVCKPQIGLANHQNETSIGLETHGHPAARVVFSSPYYSLYSRQGYPTHRIGLQLFKLPPSPFHIQFYIFHIPRAASDVLESLSKAPWVGDGMCMWHGYDKPFTPFKMQFDAFDIHPSECTWIILIPYLLSFGTFLTSQRRQHQLHSNAPFLHSYRKPMVKTKRKTIIDQNPKKLTFFSTKAQGNKKVTSKSKIIKRIATK